MLVPRLAWVSAVEAATSTGMLGLQVRVFAGHTQWLSLCSVCRRAEIPTGMRGLQVRVLTPITLSGYWVWGLGC